MNWVSYAEDIEELRQENLHYRSGIDNLIDRLRDTPSLEQIRAVEVENRKLATQLIARYESIKLEVEKRFEEALVILQDPAVRITAKLDKRTKERNGLRVELHKYKDDLAACRKSQARSLTKMAMLEGRIKSLQAEVKQLKDSEYIASQLAGVIPLKK